MTSSITDKERQIVELLGEVWNAFLELPVEHGSDTDEFNTLVHLAQNKILARVGRRALV